MGSKITFIQWSNGGKLFSLIILYSSSLQAYALSEMANVERMRNAEQQITSAIEKATNDFKERIQSIFSDNQLLSSNC